MTTFTSDGPDTTTGRINRIGVLGTGSYVPDRIVDNATVGGPAGVDDHWICRKTGISERRWVADGQATSDLAVRAARDALADARVAVGDLSLIIVATSTPDAPQPPTAAVLANLLGAPSAAAAFDLNAVCSGFVFALDMARRYLSGPGGRGRALVVAADVYSSILDPTDRRTSVLFGDAAGAAVLGSATRVHDVLGVRLSTFGHHHDLIRVPAGGSRAPTSTDTLAHGEHYFTMQGRAVTAFVHDQVPTAVHGLLEELEVDRSDIAHLVLHQANGVLIEQLHQDLGLPNSRLHRTVEEFGNTGSASVALTLDHAERAGHLHRGELVLLAAFGGGMSAGVALIRW